MSSFTQQAFNGGMNLLADDTNLEENQYRLGLNVRNRFGKLSPVANGVLDIHAPAGVKQEIRTFGEFIILFCAGLCYYRHYTATGWKRILGFQMSKDAPRFWTEVVPVLSSKYLRKLATAGNANASVTLNVVSGASAGNLSGLVVQDNINQPQFVYIDVNTGLPTSRVLQTYSQWSWTEDSSTVISGDNREYVPIGNAMAWVDGILHVVSQDYSRIYRSVEGRPLDFVVNIDENGDKGGDATTSDHSVGVGGISCLRQMSTGGLFVAAGNANFVVTKNQNPNAPRVWGEFTFIRTFLFNATCLSDRAIIDSLGDTRFIDLTGIRSFNAILQTQNEGRNSVFSLMIQSIFLTAAKENITQSATSAAAILYDNYENYAVNTILGPAVAVYDTLTQSWVGFDLLQTGGSLVKMFAKIELTVQRLYGITSDDKLYTFYRGTTYAPLIRTLSFSPKVLRVGSDGVPPNWEHKLQMTKCTFSDITEDMTASVTPFVVGQPSKVGTITKSIRYQAPVQVYSGLGQLNDVNTNIRTENFPTPNCEQGSQAYDIITWTSQAELMGFSVDVVDMKPINSLRSQT